ncbi:Hypothetical predicted protein, partial [Paramuricea clavata]
MPPARNKFAVGHFMRTKKQLKNSLAEEKAKLSLEIKNSQQQIRRLKIKATAITETKQDLQCKVPCNANTKSSTANSMRTRTPTTLEIDEMAPVTLKRRRTETFDMALMVHGGTKSNPKPAFDSLYDTLSKRCKTSALGNYVLKDSKVANYVMNNSNKKDVTTFENSNANILRSIATYYNAGFKANCPIPKILTYNKLRKQINAIDIGKVYSVEEQFSAYIQDENVKGCYRDLREYLPRLAKFYLGMQKTQKGALKWFAETEGTFLLLKY